MSGKFQNRESDRSDYMRNNKTTIERYPDNPILTPDDIPYPVETVHNAGITRFKGRIVMLFRSHLRNGRSIIGIAESDNGFKFKVKQKPFMIPSDNGIFAEYEAFGVEDPRIAKIGDDYLITYNAYSRHGVRTALAKTRDFKTVERISLISQVDMRNTVIFPDKFNGRYARLDRPHSQIKPWSIWLSWSPDLVHWGDSEVVINPMEYHWDESKIGPGTTPVKTSKGWLNIYHGVFDTMDGAVYRLGVALHDLANPAEVIGVSDDWILAPEDPWELTGYVHNVVFSCGAVEDEQGGLYIYWGGADSVMCVGTADIEALISMCLTKPRAPI